MKKKIRNLIAGAAALLLTGLAQNVQATHVQGTEMTYVCTAPGVYEVKLKIYRDCSGIPAPATASLNIKSQGCNPGRSINMSKISSGVIGNPYCPQITVGCNNPNSVYPNFEETIFAATVIFSQAELQCPDWIFSWTECCRPNTANLQGQGSFYSEAYLNIGTPTNPIYNDSPIFGSLVVPYVNAYKPITFSTYATDDEDSLVYSFTSPLEAPAVASAYQNYPSIIIHDPDTNSTKIATAPAGLYSSTFPMHSFNVDWSQTNPVATPYISLNSQNGSLSFTPTAYFPNTPSVQGLNKYVLVVKVDEYRKINGQPVKIGTIRRDMFITVMDCGPNVNPRVSNPVANGQPITPNTLITLRPGTPLNLTLAASDDNNNDILEMTSDANQIMPGATFSVSQGNRPTGTLVWVPTPADVRDQIYYFRVTVKDNACPLRGVQMQTFGVRVSNTGGVTGIKDALTKSLTFVAYPNPYSETVSFKLNVNRAAAQEILIFNTLGQQVDKISLKNLSTGEQQIVWAKGAKMANGQYIAKLVSGREVLETIKFTKQP